MDEKISITVNGEQREVLMSYALLNRLAKVVSEYDDPSVIFVDPDVQAKIIVLVLNGKQADPENDDVSDFDLSMSDGQELVKWAGGHVVNFFTNGLTTASNLSQQLEEAMKDLTPSSTGSQD